MVITTIQIGTDQGRALVGNYRRDSSSSNDRSRSGSRASTNRDKIRCYVCREYDHFVRNCPNYREERDLEQLQHMLNMEEQDHRSLSTHSSDKDCRSPLNLNSKDDATAFLPLDFRIGGQGSDSHPIVGQYLTRDRARQIYKMLDTGGIINVDTVKHEIEQEKQLDDDSGEVNPYRELVVNNAEKIEMQKPRWSSGQN